MRYTVRICLSFNARNESRKRSQKSLNKGRSTACHVSQACKVREGIPYEPLLDDHTVSRRVYMHSKLHLTVPVVYLETVLGAGVNGQVELRDRFHLGHAIRELCVGDQEGRYTVTMQHADEGVDVRVLRFDISQHSHR